MIRRPILVLLALLTLAGCTPQAALISSLIPDGTTAILLSHLQGEGESNRKRVVELENRKDWEGLAKLAEENIAKDPNSVGWLLVAGHAYTQAGRHQRAIDSYNQIVRLSPDDLIGYELLAQSYRASGQPQRSLQILNNALRVRDQAPTVWLGLGQTYEDLGRPELAVTAYRNAIKYDNELPHAWFGLGKAYAKLGRRAEFEEVLTVLGKLNQPLAKELAGLRPASR